MKKGSEELVIVIPESVKAILVDQIKKKGWVFENPATGRPYKSLQTLFNTAVQESWYRRIHPHLLRHALAKYVLEGTGDLCLVQKLLGHKSITATQIYTEIAVRRKLEGLAKASAYIDSMKLSTTPVNKNPYKKAKHKRPHVS